MSKAIINGEVITGSTNYASAITYTKEDGTKSTVQNELDELNTNLNVRYNAETDTVQIFYNGTWNDWKQGSMQDVFLYYYGDENTVLTGGWSPYAYKVASSSNAVKAPTLTKESNKMKVSYPSNNTWYSGSIFAEKPLDLTNYSKVEFVINDLTSPITGGNGGYVNLIITTTKSNSFAQTVIKQITSNGTHVLDVSNLKGEYYCCIGTSAGGNSSYSFSVESVKLIK